MNTIAIQASNSSIYLEKTLPINTEIALSTIALRKINTNRFFTTKLKIYMWIAKDYFYEYLLPSIEIVLHCDFFLDFKDLKIELSENLMKATEHFPEREYFKHFLARVKDENGHFVIIKNVDSSKSYNVEIEFLDSYFRKYLNIFENKIHVGAIGYRSLYPLNPYKPLENFSFTCSEIQPDLILNQKLRSINISAIQGDIVEIECENIFFRALKNNCYNILNFTWDKTEFQMLFFGVLIRQYESKF